MGRSYPGWRENILTSQIILLCSYGETLSRLRGKVFGCDVALNINWIEKLLTRQKVVRLKPGAHTAILVGRFRFRWMFSAKTISDRICGLIYIATFANIIHLNLNRPTKIAVCAPGLSGESCVHMGKTLSLSPRSRLLTSEISVHGKTFCLIWKRSFSYYFRTKARSRL